MRLSLGKHPGLVIVGIVILAFLAWGFRPQPVVVEIVEAKRAPLTVTIEEEGRTRVLDRYVISAPVDGVACRIEWDVGDVVRQDQTLLTITPLESRVLDPRSRAEAEARVAAANSALESARQQVESARARLILETSEVNRLRPLVEQGVVSEGEFERAQTALRVAEASLRAADYGVEVARYEKEAAETALEYTAGDAPPPPAVRVPVRSPIDGKVLKVPHVCAGPVRTGEPLIEVGNPDQLEVEVDVLSADAVRIKAGMRVLLDRWGGEEPLQGMVRAIEPVGFTKVSALGVEEQRVLVIVDITSPREQWQRLGDGYSIEARFVLWQEEDVLQVPASSLFRYEDGWALFAVQNGRAQRRPVSVGRRNGLTAQILDGVQRGEPIINHPSDQIEDGGRVTAR